MDPGAMLYDALIPSLEEVGARFERGDYFVPEMLIAALSVSGPTLRLSPRRIAELRPIVIKQARALGELLGRRTEGVHAA